MPVAGLYGHSTVFHARSNALYVFGGYEYQTDRTEVSSSMYTIDLETKTWSLLPAEVNNVVSEPDHVVQTG